MTTWSRSEDGVPTDSGADAHRRAVRRVHRQHVDLVRYVRELSARLAELEGPIGRQPASAEVGGRLAQLQSALAEHFADEERVGFVPRALDTAPRLTRRARRILAQHDLLRVELAGVAARLERGTCRWEEVRQAFRDFTASLAEHERRENELIDEALMQDLGSG